MEQKLEYINQGRGGYVVYKDGQDDIRLFFEYGGDDCVAIIYVPTIEEWTFKTNRPIVDRNSILTFVAEQAIKDQAPKSYYELSDTCIQIFTKEAT
jgi:hypothetical protein